VLGRVAESGGDEEGADFVAVQARSVGFVVDPGTPDMDGRGVVEQVLLNRVAVEPGDGR